MDIKRFVLGFLGYCIGAVLETVLIILLFFVSFTLLSSFVSVTLLGVLGLVLLVGLLGTMLFAFKVLKSGAVGMNLRSIVLTTSVMFFFSVFLIFGVVLWHLCSSRPSYHGPLVTGWVKMQPLTQSIFYRNTSFSAMFTNVLGTRITIVRVDMNETVKNRTCTVASPARGTEVKPGGTFLIKSLDCPLKGDGNIYDLIIAIKYNATVGGINANHIDMGHIKGQGEY
jgi:hypothetical protein